MKVVIFHTQCDLSQLNSFSNLGCFQFILLKSVVAVQTHSKIITVTALIFPSNRFLEAELLIPSFYIFFKSILINVVKLSFRTILSHYPSFSRV